MFKICLYNYTCFNFEIHFLVLLNKITELVLSTYDSIEYLLLFCFITHNLFSETQRCALWERIKSNQFLIKSSTEVMRSILEPHQNIFQTTVESADIHLQVWKKLKLFLIYMLTLISVIRRIICGIKSTPNWWSTTYKQTCLTNWNSF